MDTAAEAPGPIMPAVGADIWAHVLRFLPSADEVRRAQLVCRELRTAARCEALWRCQCEQFVRRERAAGGQDLDAPLALRLTGIRTYRCLHQLLETLGPRLGEAFWRCTNRQPVGALLQTAWLRRGVLAGRYITRAAPGLLRLSAADLFELHVREEAAGEGSPRLRLSVYAPPSILAGAGRVTLSFCGSEGLAVRRLGPTSQGSLAMRLATWTASALGAETGVDLVFERLASPRFSAADDARRMPRGLYVAAYGGHGLEILSLSQLDGGAEDPGPEGDRCGARTGPGGAPDPARYSPAVDEALPPRVVARKVVGDENVPSGRLSFFAPLGTVGGDLGSPRMGPGESPVQPVPAGLLGAEWLVGEIQLSPAHAWRPYWERAHVACPLTPRPRACSGEGEASPAAEGPHRAPPTLWPGDRCAGAFDERPAFLAFWRSAILFCPLDEDALATLPRAELGPDFRRLLKAQAGSGTAWGVRDD